MKPVPAANALAFLLLAPLLAQSLIPAVLADFNIALPRQTYNIGEQINPQLSILSQQGFDGIVKAAVECSGFRLQYYSTPFSAEAGYRTNIYVPELKATARMAGECSLIAYAESYEGAMQESASTAFNISNRIRLLPFNKFIEAFPSQSVLIAGLMEKASGKPVANATVRIGFANAFHTKNSAIEFVQQIILMPDIKSGSHTAHIAAQDNYGNSGSTEVEIRVIAVPSRLEILPNKNAFNPSEALEAVVSLYDQANEIINASVNIAVEGVGKSLLASPLHSGEMLHYSFDRFAAPGTYSLKARFANISAAALLSVNPVKNTLVRLENESVRIENTGNVQYDDDVTIVLESGGKKYMISRHVRLEPAESVLIDLSKEVPYGEYKIDMPRLLQDEASKSGAEDNEPIANQPAVIENVLIHDNRPAYKRAASRLEGITQALIGADGIIADNPRYASLMLVAIILLTVGYYGRGPLLRIFLRRQR